MFGEPRWEFLIARVPHKVANSRAKGIRLELCTSRITDPTELLCDTRYLKTASLPLKNKWR